MTMSEEVTPFRSIHALFFCEIDKSMIFICRICISSKLAHLAYHEPTICQRLPNQRLGNCCLHARLYSPSGNSSDIVYMQVCTCMIYDGPVENFTR